MAKTFMKRIDFSLLRPAAVGSEGRNLSGVRLAFSLTLALILCSCGGKKKAEEDASGEGPSSVEVTTRTDAATWQSSMEGGEAKTLTSVTSRRQAPMTTDELRAAVDALPVKSVTERIEAASELLSRAATVSPEEVKIVASGLFNNVYWAEAKVNPETGAEEVQITQGTIDAMVEVAAAVGAREPEFAEQLIDSAPGELRKPILEGVLDKNLQGNPAALNELVTGFDDYRVRSRFHLAKVALQNSSPEDAVVVMQDAFGWTPERAQVYVDRVVEHLEQNP